MRASAVNNKIELLFPASLTKKKPEKEVIRATVQWMRFMLTTEGLTRIKKSNETVTL
ncbi:MAG: hypothetical protein ACYSTF_07515 [Planctomycetota bacterium]|jgi:hypothetical protein